MAGTSSNPFGAGVDAWLKQANFDSAALFSGIYDPTSFGSDEAARRLRELGYTGEILDPSAPGRIMLAAGAPMPVRDPGPDMNPEAIAARQAGNRKKPTVLNKELQEILAQREEAWQQAVKSGYINTAQQKTRARYLEELAVGMLPKDDQPKSRKDTIDDSLRKLFDSENSAYQPVPTQMASWASSSGFEDLAKEWEIVAKRQHDDRMAYNTDVMAHNNREPFTDKASYTSARYTPNLATVSRPTQSLYTMNLNDWAPSQAQYQLDGRWIVGNPERQGAPGTQPAELQAQWLGRDAAYAASQATNQNTSPVQTQNAIPAPSLLDTWQQYATSQGWTAPQPAAAQPQQQSAPDWFNQAPSWWNQQPQQQPQQQAQPAAAPQTVAPAQMSLGQVQPQSASATAYPGQRYQQQSLGGLSWSQQNQGQQSGQQASPLQTGQQGLGMGGGFRQRRQPGLGMLGQQLIA